MAFIKKIALAAPLLACVCFGFSSVSAEDAAPNEAKKTSPSFMERLTTAPSALISAARFKLTGFKPDPSIDVPVVGDLRVEILDENTLCVVGAYDEFLRGRFAAECHSFLRGVDSPAANLPAWSRNVFYNVLGAEIILKYRPHIAQAFQRSKDFKISNGAEVAAGGYWINPAGQAAFPESREGRDKLTRNAFVRHYAFLELASPLRDGQSYKMITPLGQELDFKYSESENISGAIKVNQLGYFPSAGRKYAYAGAWLGSLGALPFDLDGKEFFIVDERDGSRVFKGDIVRRLSDSFYSNGAPFTGEKTYQMDFSSFGKTGRYHIYIPKVGRSLSFDISNRAVGDAFYIHAKGLYHKRCGIAKKSPYTNWPMGECHMRTWEADFPPNDTHYKAKNSRTDCGFFDENGKPFEVDHFKLIAACATDKVLNLHGGWHDAADYDRRPYHYDVVVDLLSAYIFRPENFSDSQLNIPESGNGIPDIIDEAAWGMRIWYDAQKPSGATPGWIEAVSHPQDYNPSTDVQRYYLSAATRESTMQYAAHASMLALAYKIAGADDMSKKYLDSSLKAFAWAQNPANTFVKTYNYPVRRGSGKKAIVENKKLTYKEAPEVPAEFVFKAAFNLWMLTKDEKYLDVCRSINSGKMSQKFANTSWCLNPLFFSEFLKYGRDAKGLEKIFKIYRERMLKYADERMEWLDKNYPYRIPWYPPEHPYVGHMSWGKFHPFNNAKFFMNAYELTNDRSYRDAAYLCSDWHNGANPLGMTMTSGLGQVYPLRFLDLISYSDGIAEYVRGITPYRNTFGIARGCAVMAESLIYEPRKDRDFEPPPIMLLPPSMIGEGPFTADTFAKKLGTLWPIWRRFANVEAFSVAASEYTISETIAPAAALSGWLLEKGYKPSEAIKNTQPADDLRKLKGYWPLP